jgi:transcriptional regulator with PAS, ATPase and Fis domain
MEEVMYLKGSAPELHVTHTTRRMLLPPDVIKTVRLLASNPQTCALILGETGTGKGMVATAIHELSERRENPFVDVNCAGLNEALLESELMGHERGAFTDAKTAKRGLIEVADRGTLFLDEIGELTLPIQAKMLKVIEERTFRHVGGTVNLSASVRIIAATNANLEQAVKAGRFRSDLFFRLNVLPLTLPPLRKRREEIPQLTSLFLAEFATAMKKPGLRISPEAETMLLFYSWPGNIRELRNVIERAVLLCEDDTVMPAHLPGNLRSRASQSGSLPALGDFRLETVEARHIENVLRACGGNRSNAAKLLGIHRATLIKKIRLYNLGEIA